MWFEEVKRHCRDLMGPMNSKGIPDRQFTNEGIDRITRSTAPQSAAASGIPKVRSSRPNPQATVPPPPPQPHFRRAEPTTQPQKSRSRPASRKQTPSGQPKKPRKRLAQRLKNLLYSWQLWVVTAALICGGTGTFALAVLLRLPSLPNCPAVFWPLAPASLRFECARLAASKQTAKDLLEAITLVDSLPENHPLREEANRLVELWSQEVLNLAEDLFNQGKLADAIAAARRIPAKASSYKVVEERVSRWQKVWSEAEEIYRKAEAELRKLDWRKAFLLAARLMEIENEYWRTQKFDELSARITTAREDGNKLGQAERIADDGGLANLLEAINLAKSISPGSYVYPAAQKAIGKFGRRMLDLAQEKLDRRDLQEALNIVGKIPPEAKLEQEADDFTVLANAQAQSWQGTVAAVEEAISQAQRIGPKSPLYRKAKQWIARWQFEIAGIAQLERARVLAQSGAVHDLQAAIAQAAQISSSNPKWDEAQEQIRKWRTEIETIQDRPILEQADLIASQGDIPSLQAAVDQLSRISQGRALSREAQTKIRDWTDQIQRIQDQPFLDQARDYANAGNLDAAIATAEKIRSGRALYQEAQAEIKTWKDKIYAEQMEAQAQANLQEAYRLASAGSINNLVSAIQLANRIPTSSSVRADANAAIDEWSSLLLESARSQAVYDVPGAIATAQKIPSRSSMYSEAQSQIAAWREVLNQKISGQ